MSDTDADRDAIIALIHRNRIAIWTSDWEVWESCFVHSSYSTRWGWWRSGGVFVRRGWDDISARARLGGPPVNLRNAHETTVENLTLRIMGDMAWATFEQHYPELNNAGHLGPGIVHELRVFERHDGQWKIALLGIMDANAAPDGAIIVRLDSAGLVLWQSPAAREMIAASDDVVIRAGRLRFRDRTADRKLTDALAWAARLDAAYMSRHGAVPILVEAGEGLASRIYWLAIDGGIITPRSKAIPSARTASRSPP